MSLSDLVNDSEDYSKTISIFGLVQFESPVLTVIVV